VIEPRPQPADELVRGILAVTDAALSSMATDALFNELLDRLLVLLNADTAAIMLLERETNQLVTVATVGIEDEVRQGFRLAVGAGFTGKVAASRSPVIIERVDADSVTSGVLRATGVATLAGVPMLAGGELIGVLHVGTYQPRSFREQDVALLQLVADRAALASQVSRQRDERAATLALQRSLLPNRLPILEGLDLAGRYLPGHQLGVGGDWYDVFVLPTGDLGVVVGDVSGHGLQSAVVMGRLRSALRAYALIEPDPAEVLTLLNRKIEHFEAGELATVLYATIDRNRNQMLISTAGHLPPILAVPGRAAKPLELAVDLPVGIGHVKPRRTIQVELPRGSTIVLFTDGLVERRYEPLDAGIQRLASRVRAEPAELVCASIMADLDTDRVEDDIAVLAIHVAP
jgi:putative methionine-R-sulfoxide reductase with GAF domain